MSTPTPRIIVFTAPSGAGKSTIARRVMDAFPQMRFSVSATTRPPRAYETDGEHYHFMTETAFREAARNGELLEYEEVYPGRFYGTLRSEVDRATPDAPVLLDIEVLGAVNIKKAFGADAFVVFIAPPSLDELERRLRSRGTEDPGTLRTRLSRATKEITYADDFDARVLNDDLETAVASAIEQVGAFLNLKPQTS